MLPDHELQLGVRDELISEYTDLFKKLELEGPDDAQGFGYKHDQTFQHLNKDKSGAIQYLTLYMEAGAKNRLEMEPFYKAPREKGEIFLPQKVFI